MKIFKKICYLCRLKKIKMGKEFKLEDLCKTCANYNNKNNTCAYPFSKQITTDYDGVTLYRDCDRYIPNCKIEKLETTK